MIRPQGTLIAVGGAEDKGTDLELGIIHRNNLNFFELGILKRVLQESGRPDAHIEVISTASATPREVGQNYLSAFGRLGATNVGHIPIRDREDAHDPEFVRRIEQADVIWFTGGNQYRLTSTFGGTQFLSILKNRYQHEHIIVAGTSAGAMAMSSTMIYEGNSGRAHLKGEVKFTTGLGFHSSVIFDSHFDKRGRFARLVQAVAANPSSLGIGLGEDTGVIITEGHQLEAIGSGMVVIVDGHQIRHSNIADIPEGNPISLEHLVVHFLASGDRFDLEQRRFIPKAVEVKVEE
ncbi:MAG: cyanophycinase [Chitinophagales bacterium]|nr:cyanophycinase [Chitinophagales bacterium]MDW8394253.1 cyanophycinase [Chitinophagales bacterium]